MQGPDGNVEQLKSRRIKEVKDERLAMKLSTVGKKGKSGGMLGFKRKGEIGTDRKKEDWMEEKTWR